MQHSISIINRSEAELEATKATKAKAAKRRVYFHVPCHPDNPKARVIRQLWSKHMALPDGDDPLNECVNVTGAVFATARKIIFCFCLFKIDKQSFANCHTMWLF